MMEREHSLIFILLSRYIHLPAWADTAIMAGLAILIISFLAIFVTRRLSLFSPSRLQSGVELGVSALNNFVGENLKKEEADFFAPFLGSLFIYILIMNLLSVIPGFVPPTMDLNVTIALALVTFLVVQYSGIRKKGFWGYLKHISEWELFAHSPIYLLPFCLLGAMFFGIIHFIGELAKPFSLAVRLFANMYGEETMVLSFVVLSPVVFRFLAVPFQFPFVLFHMFIGFLQAYIFTVLATIYISIATTEE
ncbi:F0F1 ATP synthase subunit A [bacterium]|nr:F0F1 ATP synthase subunit A [bacterium]